MVKFAGFLILLIVVLGVGVNASIRAKRQFYGPMYGPRPYGMAGGMLGQGYAGGMYGPGLTPGQMLVDRSLAVAQARGRQAVLNSQMITNQAVQRANFNAALLGAEARTNAMMLGK